MDDLTPAREAGHRLGLALSQSRTTGRPSGLTLATVTGIHPGDRPTLDLDVDGATITGVPMTTDCVTAVTGDRVLVMRAGRTLIAVGILARPDSYKPAILPGDTITVTNISTAGYVTGSGKNLYCVIPLNRRMIGATEATCISSSMNVQQNNAYLIGSSNTGGADVTDQVRLTILPESGLRVTVSGDAAWPNVTNNSPIGFQIGTMTIQFK